MFVGGELADFMNYSVQIGHLRFAAAGLIDPGPPRPPYIGLPENYEKGGRETGRRWAELQAEFSGPSDFGRPRFAVGSPVMNVAPKFPETPYKSALPASRALYYGGKWRQPSGGYAETYNPANGESLGKTAVADGRDVDAAVQAAKAGFASWRHSKPLERGAMLRRIAAAVRENARELALIDAANCGNPVAELMKDTAAAAAYLDLFAGIAPEAKGSTLPMGEGVVNYTQREPIGVVARIVAYNHPLLFLCAKLAPAVAAGNCVIMKPPTQAPLSAYRLMELVDGVLPAGVLNVVTGGVECGAALTTHPDVPMVTVVGSAQTGRAIMRQASDRLKRLVFELGGKNALVVYPDADIPRTIAGAVKGMNFGWAGQSCGSTSRAVPAPFDLRRGAGRGDRRSARLPTRRPDRRRHQHGIADLRSAARQGARLHPNREGRGGAARARRWRPRRGGVRARLFCRADDLRGRRQRDARGEGRDLRASLVGDPLA